GWARVGQRAGGRSGGGRGGGAAGPGRGAGRAGAARPPGRAARQAAPLRGADPPAGGGGARDHPAGGRPPVGAGARLAVQARRRGVADPPFSRPTCNPARLLAWIFRREGRTEVRRWTTGPPGPTTSS